jgi:hypothetical protein
MEIWGLGTEEDLKNHHTYWQQRGFEYTFFYAESKKGGKSTDSISLMVFNLKFSLKPPLGIWIKYLVKGKLSGKSEKNLNSSNLKCSKYQKEGESTQSPHPA